MNLHKTLLLFYVHRSIQKMQSQKLPHAVFFFIFLVFMFYGELKRRKDEENQFCAQQQRKRLILTSSRKGKFEIKWGNIRLTSRSSSKKKNAITVKRVLLFSWNTNSRPLNWSAHFDNFLLSRQRPPLLQKELVKLIKLECRLSWNDGPNERLIFFTMHSIFVLLHSCQ